MSTFFKITCPGCNKSLKVPDNLAGKSRACPYCRATVRIPETAPPEPEIVFPNIRVSEGTAKRTATTPKAPKEVIQRKRVVRNWFSTGSSDSANSDVSLVLSGLMGIIATVVFYALLYPVRDSFFGQLFWQRGPVPFPTTCLMFWAIAILILKWNNLKKQKTAMLLDILPTDISQEITVGGLDAFIKNINELPGATSDTFLVNRVVRGIEHFRARNHAAETVTMMGSQAEIDANNVNGSYTILKVFIWALPILGFIGTVMGVSAAVASLAGSLSDGGSMDAMKVALKDVFGGLGTAFDTTLLALIMSLMVKIPASALQKAEEDLLTSVDEYCNENLLRRLNDGRRQNNDETRLREPDGDMSAFREAVEQALGTRQAELEKWLGKLDKIGDRLTDQVAQGWERVNGQIEQQQHKHVELLNKQQLDQQARLQAQLDQMANAADKIQMTLNRLAEQAGTMQNEVTGSFSNAQETLQENLEGVRNGLQGLNEVLSKLSEHQVVIQQVPTPSSRWFGFGKPARRNGKH
ncbi:MAG TPA: hypothetical protein DDZ51_16730 [Planctomycetaceae bacterium]|nr:hypothetical protein [Planctomycetaceae bacterium]